MTHALYTELSWVSGSGSSFETLPRLISVGFFNLYEVENHGRSLLQYFTSSSLRSTHNALLHGTHRVYPACWSRIVLFAWHVFMACVVFAVHAYSVLPVDDKIRSRAVLGRPFVPAPIVCRKRAAYKQKRKGEKTKSAVCSKLVKHSESKTAGTSSKNQPGRGRSEGTESRRQVSGGRKVMDSTVRRGTRQDSPSPAPASAPSLPSSRSATAPTADNQGGH